MIQKVMALIFGYTIDHRSRSEDEATMQLLGIRLFNAGASGVKLAFSGYYQTAFHQARDIMETGFLVDYFRTSPEQRAVWKRSDRKMRRELFDPVKIRSHSMSETVTRRKGERKSTTSCRNWRHMQRFAPRLEVFATLCTAARLLADHHRHLSSSILDADISALGGIRPERCISGLVNTC
jgi:hypothetical protein